MRYFWEKYRRVPKMKPIPKTKPAAFEVRGEEKMKK